MKAWLLSMLIKTWGLAGSLFARTMANLRDAGTFDRALELATVWVARLAGDTSVDNATKRNVAMDEIAKSLAREGRTLRDSLVALAIELAVNAAKASAGK
jgi:hypothetical protein